MGEIGGRAPQVTTFNPATSAQAGAQNAAGGFAQNILQSHPTQITSLLQGLIAPQAAGLQTAARQTGSAGLSPGIGDAFSGILNQAFLQNAGANPFTEARDPFGALGGMGAGRATVAAAAPQFAENLTRANTELARVAPGRFSSAAAQQGTDLNRGALQDFNLFAQQALMQGLGLDSADRGQARNFLLGARGLQQGAVNDARQGAIGAANAQTQAAGTLGSLQQQAANSAFGNQLAAAQFGQQSMNPALQLIMSALGYAGPGMRQAIVDPGQAGFNPLGALAPIVGGFAGQFLGNQFNGNGMQQPMPGGGGR